jgi:NitT/TauT family transport system substrate-binding protein
VFAVIALLVAVVACAPAPTPMPTAAPAAPTTALAAPATAAPTPASFSAQSAGDLTKFPFRLNWTLYGEHAPFFVALDKGFYRDEGLDVEIMQGSGSTTVATLVANGNNPVAYVDSATMMTGVTKGMPIESVGVTLQQSPMAFIYRADNPRPSTIDQIKGSRIAITAGDASLAIFTAFMGKLGMSLDDVKMITVATPAAKEQAVLNGQADALLGYFMDQGPRMQMQSGVKMGWTRLYDMAGVTTLSSSYIVNKNWLTDPKNQDLLRRFLRASQRGWQYTADHPDEAADIFVKYDPAFTKEIALLEIKNSLSIVHTKATEGKPMGWTAKSDWQDSQNLLSKYAGLTAMPDVSVYFTDDYLSEPPYMPAK